MTNATAALIGMALLLAVALVGGMDLESEIRSHELYCEMTALYQQTQGEYGWPEYQENIECP